MDKWDEALEEIFKAPEFAHIKAPVKRVTKNDRLLNSFDEIVSFVEKEGRLPSNEGDLVEKGLAQRLSSIREDKDKYDLCLPHDKLHLLGDYKEKTIDEQLDEILDDPIFDVSPESKALFDIPDYMKRAEEKRITDYIGKRKPCKEFKEKYEMMFRQVQDDIDSGRKKLVKFRQPDMVEGAFFVDHGQIVFLEKIDTKKLPRWGVDRHIRLDGRIHCIYDNGTESDILFRSLGKSLYSDGYSIRDASVADDDVLKQSFTVSNNDVQSGYVYVLRSLSTDPEVASIKDLHKIGFTTQTVEKRIENAKNEATYLYSDVVIVAKWRVYNIKAVVLENALHHVFSKAQLQLTAGAKRPKEWYVVPFAQIEEGINRLISGEKVGYEPSFQKIVVEK